MAVWRKSSGDSWSLTQGIWRKNSTGNWARVNAGWRKNTGGSWVRFFKRGTDDFSIDPTMTTNANSIDASLTQNDFISGSEITLTRGTVDPAEGTPISYTLGLYKYISEVNILDAITPNPQTFLATQTPLPELTYTITASDAKDLSYWFRGKVFAAGSTEYFYFPEIDRLSKLYTYITNISLPYQSQTATTIDLNFKVLVSGIESGETNTEFIRSIRLDVKKDGVVVEQYAQPFNSLSVPSGYTEIAFTITNNSNIVTGANFSYPINFEDCPDEVVISVECYDTDQTIYSKTTPIELGPSGGSIVLSGPSTAYIDSTITATVTNAAVCPPLPEYTISWWRTSYEADPNGIDTLIYTDPNSYSDETKSFSVIPDELGAGGQFASGDEIYAEITYSNNVGSLQLTSNKIMLLEIFSLTYSANGGTGSQTDPNSPYSSPNLLVTVLGVGTIQRLGYTFLYWNTLSNGTGTSYDPGDTFIIGEDTTLYAQWKFDAPGTPTFSSITETSAIASWSANPAASSYRIYWYDNEVSPPTLISNQVVSGTSYTITGLTPGMSYAADVRAYSGVGGTGDQSDLSGQGYFTTLLQYTVTWNANGGTVTPTSSTVSAGSSVTAPTPTRTGYTFNGWYTAPSGGSFVVNAGSSYTPYSSITLYAQWTFNAPGTPSFSSITETSAVASWTGNPAPGANYRVLVYNNDVLPPSLIQTITNISSTSTTITGLSAGTSYYAQVRAYSGTNNTGDQSALSDAGYFTTAANIAPIMSSASVSPTSYSSTGTVLTGSYVVALYGTPVGTVSQSWSSPSGGGSGSTYTVQSGDLAVGTTPSLNTDEVLTRSGNTVTIATQPTFLNSASYTWVWSASPSGATQSGGTSFTSSPGNTVTVTWTVLGSTVTRTITYTATISNIAGSDSESATSTMSDTKSFNHYAFMSIPGTTTTAATTTAATTTAATTTAATTTAATTTTTTTAAPTGFLCTSTDVALAICTSTGCDNSGCGSGASCSNPVNRQGPDC